MDCFFLLLFNIIRAIEKFICTFLYRIKSNIFILWRIKEQLNRIEKMLLSMCQPKTIEFYTIINGQKTKVEKMFLKLTEKLPLSIEIKDALGNAAQVDGAPQWALDNPALGSLSVAGDGLSAEFTPGTQANSSVVVQVSCDADLGEGVKTILGSLVLDLVSGEAVSVSIVAGTPVPL